MQLILVYYLMCLDEDETWNFCRRIYFPELEYFLLHIHLNLIDDLQFLYQQ